MDEDNIQVKSPAELAGVTPDEQSAASVAKAPAAQPTDSTEDNAPGTAPKALSAETKETAADKSAPAAAPSTAPSNAPPNAPPPPSAAAPNPTPAAAKAPPAPTGPTVGESRKAANDALTRAENAVHKPYDLSTYSSTHPVEAAKMAAAAPASAPKQSLWESWHNSLPGHLVDGFMKGPVSLAQKIVDLDFAGGQAAMHAMGWQSDDVRQNPLYPHPEQGFNEAMGITPAEEQSKAYQGAAATTELGTSLLTPVAGGGVAAGLTNMAERVGPSAAAKVAEGISAVAPAAAKKILQGAANYAIPRAAKIAAGGAGGVIPGVQIGAAEGAAGAMREGKPKEVVSRALSGGLLGGVGGFGLGLGGAFLIQSILDSAKAAIALKKLADPQIQKVIQAHSDRVHNFAGNTMMLASTLRKKSLEQLRAYHQEVGPQPPANEHQAKQQQILALKDSWDAVGKIIADNDGTLKASNINEQSHIDYIKGNTTFDTNEKIEKAVENRLAGSAEKESEGERGWQYYFDKRMRLEEKLRSTRSPEKRADLENQINQAKADAKKAEERLHAAAEAAEKKEAAPELQGEVEDEPSGSAPSGQQFGTSRRIIFGNSGREIRVNFPSKKEANLFDAGKKMRAQSDAGQMRDPNRTERTQKQIEEAAKDYGLSSHEAMVAAQDYNVQVRSVAASSSNTGMDAFEAHVPDIKASVSKTQKMWDPDEYGINKAHPDYAQARKYHDEHHDERGNIRGGKAEVKESSGPTRTFNHKGHQVTIEFPSKLEAEVFDYASTLDPRGDFAEVAGKIDQHGPLRTKLSQDLHMDPSRVDELARDYAHAVKDSAVKGDGKASVINNSKKLQGDKILGEFRFQTGKEGGKDITGFGVIAAATHINDPRVKDVLGDHLYGEVKEAVEAIGSAEAARLHARNELKAYAENALDKAKQEGVDDNEIEKKILPPRLNHEMQKEADNYKAKKYEEQESTRKAIDLVLREYEREKQYAKAAAKKRLEDEIIALQAELSKLGNPMDIFSAQGEKYLYGIAEEKAFERPEYRSLGKTYVAARAQAIKAAKQLEAANAQYDAVKAYFKPTLEKADEAWKTGNDDPLARLWVKTDIHDPFFPELKTEFAIGLQHNALTCHLNGIFRTLHDQFVAELMAKTANVVQETAYAINGLADLGGHNNADLLKILKEGGLVHPIALKAMVAGGAGMTTMDLSALATNPDDLEKNPQDHLFTLLGVATIGGAMAGKFGIGPTLAMLKHPLVTVYNALRNTTALVAVADQKMVSEANKQLAEGVPPFVLGVEHSLQGQMIRLGGAAYNAIMRSPDDARFFLLGAKHSLSDEMIKENVSEKGQELMKDLQHQARTFRGFVSKYTPKFNKMYSGLTPDEQKALAGPHAAVNFIDKTFMRGDTPSASLEPLDRVMYGLFSSFNKAIFGGNIRLVLHMAEYSSVYLNHVVGPEVTLRAEQAYLTNPIARAGVRRIWIGGAHSEQVQDASLMSGMPNRIQALDKAEEIADKLPLNAPLKAAISIARNIESRAALPHETMQAHLGILAGLIQWFDTHESGLKALGINNQEDFLREFFRTETPDSPSLITKEQNADMMIHLWGVMSDFLPGADVIGLVRGPLGRSKLGKTVSYFRYQENSTRLIAANLSRGPEGLKWVAAAHGMLFMLAGSAVIPQEAQIISDAIAPEHTAKLRALINLMSVGSSTIGNMSHYMSFSAMYPITEVANNPMLESARSLVERLPETNQSLAYVYQKIAHGEGGDFLADPKDPEAQKAQKALHAIDRQLWFILGAIAGVGSNLIGNGLYNAPPLMHGNFRVTVPNRIDIPGRTPAEQEKLAESVGMHGSPRTDMLAQLLTNSHNNQEAYEKFPQLHALADTEAQGQEGFNNTLEAVARAFGQNLTIGQIDTMIEGNRNVLGMPSGPAVTLHQIARGVPGSHSSESMNALDENSGVRTTEPEKKEEDLVQKELKRFEALSKL